MLTQLDFFIVFLYHYTSQTNVDNMLQSLGTYILLPWNLQKYNAWILLMEKIAKIKILKRKER